MEDNSEKKGDSVEGFSLSGDEVAGMKDARFVIAGEPQYREVNNLDRPGTNKRKLIVPVTLLASGINAEWYANKTSQKKIIAQRGRILKNWIGFEGTFVAKNQIVGENEKKVIYIQ